MSVKSNSFVITGTSGSGKTRLIEHLSERGFTVHREATRLVLEQQSAIDGPGLPAKDPELFLNLMLGYCVRCLDEAKLVPLRVTFFDRGIPDVIAYAVRFGVKPERFLRAARKHTFNRNVFVLPPWKNIFVPDEFRGKTFEEYKKFHQIILDAYEYSGCRLIEVPMVSVSDRAEYVIKKVCELGQQ